MLQNQLARIDAAVQTAKRLHDKGDLNGAIAALRSIPLSDDPELAPQQNDMLRRIEDLTNEREIRERDVQQSEIDCEAALKKHQYADVIERLSQFHEQDRTERIRNMLRHAETACREIADLRKTIVTLVEERRFTQIAPHIDRLMSLQPCDERTMAISVRVRDWTARRIKEALQSAEYQQARQLLESLPLSSINESTEELRSTVREIARLYWELRNAQHVDAGLVAVAERLCELAPRDVRFQEMREKVQSRLRRVSAGGDSQINAWAVAKDPTHVGLPVEWLGGFRKLHAQSPDVENAIRRHDGQFYIAAGLALHGLGMTESEFNLLPRSPSAGLFGKFASLKKPPAYRSAWGLDIGSTGIKAIRLGTLEKGNQAPVIFACDVFDYSAHGALPESEVSRVDMIRKALRQWQEKYSPGEQDAIGVSCPRTKTLTRFLDLPPANAGKLEAVIRNEVGQKIPVPLTDLSWTYRLVQRNDRTYAIVSAMRVREALDLIQPLREIGLAAHAIQPESIALHNCMAFDGLPSLGDSQLDVQDIAVLDIGSTGTNLLVMSPDCLWFRTLRYGGDNVSAAAVRQFKLTFEQAEQLKREKLTKARLGERMVYTDQILAKFVDEFQRSRDAFQKDYPERKLGRLFLCGGGARQFGLLRHLRNGPYRDESS